MLKIRITALVLLIISFLVGFFVYYSEFKTGPDGNFKFKLGLDLDGGTHLTYVADVSKVPANEVNDSMDALRQTVERRINVFGVSEPIVQVEKTTFLSDQENQNRLIVELPGITDVSEAIEMIGKTPLLEFKILNPDQSFLESITASTTEEELAILEKDMYISTGLTGAQLKRAEWAPDPITNSSTVNVEFNEAGKDLLAKLTKENLGQVMPIFLDGVVISSPVIRDVIYNGVATISGQFDADEAKSLVRDLNFGALPVPITLMETQTIGATLGNETLVKGIQALIWGMILIFAFMVIFYRLPGLVASIALVIYVAMMLAVFKLIPVTLTASGLAGFILSLGMAVDANILIFARLKEEVKSGSNLHDAVKEGTKRAWSSIRDGNLSSLLSAIVLFSVSGTSLVRGFALVFGIGVLVSMITAISISRSFLLALSTKKGNAFLSALFGCGFKK